MDNAYRLIAGALTTMALATSAMVVLPYTEVHRLKAPEGLQPYSASELRGRQQYINLGCMTCHSQQPRGTESGVDGSRGWGRPSVPEDYVHDAPPLLGTMRTGPDLFNIGSRQPSIDWHLGHLYQPRAYVPGSNMPAFPFLFEHKAQAGEGERLVSLPEGAAPRTGVVVARPEALDLVNYLLALDRTYPAPQQ
ncbi:cbb3-type cytochrome c oxidase subunit II [Parahaliea mediterranea]|uniref:Cbb3-type cytochrome c oxidase subunit II n=1 Tax=Parahaliea mediterranea TaxID=651086 RepID=A0A939ILL6_9GAMM|nr:cbb3-type cytochrome c oxidase subunit II [Parahaliea mediterranea]MBN7796097.1 cbb3-type cytochrome c oxidase subunit II [Parahaliea mediterranea]